MQLRRRVRKARQGLHAPLPLAVLLAMAFGTVAPAGAAPLGAQVVNGTATVVRTGPTTTITNSPGAIINWQSFSIGSGETARFIQQSANSAVLNRVVGQDPSQILGTLSSNGKVFLVNPNGMVFGQGAVVDTAGLVLSTLQISDDDFRSGRMRFIGGAGSVAGGEIRIEGVLRSASGDIYLVAPNIENRGAIKAENGQAILAAGEKVEILGRGLDNIRFEVQNRGNQAVNLGRIEGNAVGMFAGTIRQGGTVSANSVGIENGKVVLRALGDVVLAKDSRTTAAGVAGSGGAIAVSAVSGAVRIETGAEVRADASAPARAGGNIVVRAQEANVVVADGALVSASGGQGGRVVLQADAGQTVVAGKLLATGTQEAAVGTSTAPVAADAPALPAAGGVVHLLGKEVAVVGHALVDASGDAGGGTVLVGGDWQGSNPLVQNAQNTYVGDEVLLRADARLRGDGGKAVVWAQESTIVRGSIDVRGGNEGGNGGDVETSGKQYLLVTRPPWFNSRRNGKGGTWLLDPTDIEIVSGAGSGDIDTVVLGGDTIYQPSAVAGAVSSQLDVAVLNAALTAGGAVYINTHSAAAGVGDIKVLAPISAAGTNPATLSLDADRDIIVGADIRQTNPTPGVLNITMNAHPTALSGGVFINPGVTIDTAGGRFQIASEGGFVNNGTVTTRAPAGGGAGGTAAITVVGDITIGGALNAPLVQFVAPGTINANVLADRVELQADTATITNTGSLVLGPSTVTTSLTVHNSGGAITQPAGAANALVLSNASLVIDNPGGAITLDNPANDISAVGVTGTSATLINSGDLQIISAQLTGGLTGRALGGSVYQVLGQGGIQAGGAVQLTASAGTVGLFDSQNEFSGGIAVTGTAAAIVNNGPLRIDGVTADQFMFSNTGGDVTQGAGAIQVADLALLLNPGGAITLNNALNSFTNGIAVTAGSATIAAAGPVKIGGASVTAALSINAGGAIDQNGPSLTFGAGGLTTGATEPIVAGTAEFTAAGTITLDHANNSIMGALRLSGGSADVHSASVLLDSAAITGSLDVTARSGSITQTGTGTGIQAAGDAHFVATDAVVLDRAGNVFGGEVHINAGTSATVVNSGTLRLGNLSAPSGAIVRNDAGDVNQVAGASINAAMLEVHNPGNAINLDQGTNNVGILTLTGGSAGVTTSAALELRDVALTGDLVLNQLAGAITQTAGAGHEARVGGATTITSAAGLSASLTNPDNVLTGVVTVTGGQSASLFNVGNLQLGRIVLTDTLTVFNRSGDVTQSALAAQNLVAGTLNITGSGAITLDNAANQIANLVLNSGTAARLSNTGALALGRVDATGGLTLINPGGAVTQSTNALDRMVAGAASSFDVGGALSLNNAFNQLTGPVTVLAATDFTLAHRAALRLGNITTTGQVQIDNNNGAVTQQGGTTLNVGGATTIRNFGSATTLDQAGNTFGGALALAGASAAVQATGGVILADVSLGTTLDVTATGTISQFAGTSILTGGLARFSAGNDVVLNNAGNGFFGGVNVQANGGAQLLGDNFLILDALDVNGDLALNLQAGVLSQTSGASHRMRVGGTTTLNAAAGLSATLDNPANVFTGAVTLSGGQSVTLANSGNLQLGRVALTDTLTIANSGGAVTQSALAAQNIVAGTIDVTGSGAVTLDNVANQIGTAVLNSGGALALSNTGSLSLGRIDATGGLNLVNVGGSVTQSLVPADRMITGAPSSFNVDGTLTLGNLANQLGGAVTVLAATDFTAVNLFGLTLGDIAATGTVDVTSRVGSVSQQAGTTIQAAGLARFSGADDVVLTNAGNVFAGGLNVTAGANAQLLVDSALTLDGLDVTGNLDLTHQVGAFTQTAGALHRARVGGTTTITSAAGMSAMLDNPANLFTGAVTLSGGQSVNLANSGVLRLRSVSLTGTLAIANPNSDVTQFGAAVDNIVTGTLDVTAGGAIALDNPANQIGTAVLNSGGAAALSNTGALNLGRIDAPGGLTLVNAGGAVTQSLNPADRMVTGAASSFDVGGALNLGNAANQFGGAVTVLAATDLALANSGVLTLGGITTSGIVQIDNAFGAILQQAGTTFNAGGATTISNPGGAITLGQAGNTFGGTLGLNGHSATVQAAGDVTLDAVTLTGPLNVTASGTIAQQPAATIQAGDLASFSGGGDVVLGNAGNLFSSGLSFQANGSAQLRVDNPVLLWGVDVGGDFALNDQAGAISQTTGVPFRLRAGGTTTINAAAGVSTTLTNPDNVFTGAVILSGGSVNLTGTGNLQLGRVALTDTLTIAQSGGDVTQSALAAQNLVAGTLNVTGSGAVTLDNAANQIANVVLNSGAAARLSNTGALNLGRIDTVGGFTLVNAGGSVSQSLNPADRLFAGAAARFDVAGALSLANPINQIGGGLTVLAATDLTVAHYGPLNLNGIAASGRVQIDNQSGAIAQGAGTSFNAGGAVTIGNPDGAISLDQLGNTFGGALGLSGTSVTVMATSGVTLDNVTLVPSGTPALRGPLDVTAGGTIVQQAGTQIRSGATRLVSGGDVVLMNAGNTYGGGLSVQANGGAQLLADSHLTLDALDVNGDFVLNHQSGTIAQSAGPAYAWRVGGTTTITSAAGLNTSLTNSANVFTGAVTLSGGQSVNLASSGNLQLGAVTLTGTLTVANSGGNVTQSALAAEKVTAATINVTSSGAVTLDNAANQIANASLGSGGAATLANAGSLVLRRIDASGGFNLTTVGGSVTQSSTPTDRFAAGAASSFDIDGALTVDNAANQFTGPVTVLRATGVTLANQASLNLGAVTIAGAAQFTLGAGAVTQSLGTAIDAGSLTVTGKGIGVVLDQANNRIGTLTLSAGSAQVNVASPLQVRAVDLSGALTLVADGPVSAVTPGKGTGLRVGGMADITSVTGDITLADPANQFSGGLRMTSANATVASAGAVALGSMVLTGGLDVSATSGTVSQQAGASIQAGGLVRFASGGDVVLTNAGNVFSGGVQLSGVNATVTSAAALPLANVTLSGGLDVSTTSGAISQQPGTTIQAAGLARMASVGDVVLNNAGNVFGGGLNVQAAGGAQLLADRALTLDGVDLGGDLAMNHLAGALAQTSGASHRLRVGGTTTITSAAGMNAILNNPANVFTGVVTLSGGQSVSLANTGNLQLGAVSLTDTLTVANSGGSVTQSALAAQNLVAGTLNVTGSGAVTLDNAVNQIGTVVLSSGGAATLANTGALTLGRIDATGAFNLTNVGGSVTQSSNPADRMVTGAAASFNVDGALSLANTSNQLGGAVHVPAATDVTVVNSVALTLGNITTTGTLDVSTTSGGIGQQAATSIQSMGLARVDSADYAVLTGFGNQFAGGLNLRAGSFAQLYVDNPLSLDALDVAGDFRLIHWAGALSQAAGPLHAARVGGATTIVANTGATSMLTNPANVFSGTVTISSGDSVSLANTGTLRLGSVALTDTLTIANTGGDVVQSIFGQGIAAGTIDVTTTGVIDLRNDTNQIGTVALNSGSYAALSNNGALTLGRIDAAGGFNLFNVGGAVTQSMNPADRMVTGADSSFDVDGAVSLGNPSNQLGGALSVYNATDLTVVNSAALSLGTINVTGTLDVSTTSGGISQLNRQVIQTGGLARFASPGDVVLPNNLNQFSGGLNVQTGGNAQLLVTKPMTLDGLDVAGDFSLNHQAGAFAQTAGALHRIRVGGATTITSGAGLSTDLTNPANVFTGAVTIAGGQSVNLANTGPLQLGAVALTDTLTVANSGGNVSQSALVAQNIVAPTLDVTSSGAIILNNAANQIGTVVLNSGGAAALSNTGALALGRIDAPGGLTLVNAGGSVTQSLNPADRMLTAAPSSFNVGGALNLGNAANQFGGTVAVAAATDLTLANAGVLSLGGITTAGRVQIGNASGAITQQAGTSINAGGATTISNPGGNIVLDAAGNDFSAGLGLTGASATVVSGGGVRLAPVVLTGNLAVNAAGPIDQGAAPVQVAGTLDLTSNGGIALGDTGNSFAGVVNLTNSGAGNVDLAAGSRLLLGNVVGGTGRLSLRSTAAGGIAQGLGATLVQGAGAGGLDLVADAGAIRLDNAGNLLTGPVSANAATSVTLRNTGTLALGAVMAGTDVSANAARIDANGAMTAAGAVGLAATTALNVANVVQAGGTLNLAASTIDVAGAAARLSAGGDLGVSGTTVNVAAPVSGVFVQLAGSNFLGVQGDVSATRLTLDAASGNLAIGTTTAAPATMQSTTVLSMNASGNIDIGGGAGSVSIVSAGNATVSAGGTLRIKGGTTAGAFTLLDPSAPGSVLDITANGVVLTGGATPNAYAAIYSSGNINLNLGAGGLSLFSGAGLNADAAVVAPNGFITLTGTCITGCPALTVNPLFNTPAEIGMFSGAASVPATGAPAAITAAEIAIDATNNAAFGGTASQVLRYATDPAGLPALRDAIQPAEPLIEADGAC